MSERRRRFTAALKAKVAVEAIKGSRTVNELASVYGVHPAQIVQWKKRAMESLPELFADGRRKPGRDGEVLAAELYQQIGQLKVELDFLKKKTGLLG